MILDDRAAVLAATGDQPYVRLCTPAGATVQGYAEAGTVVWTARRDRWAQAFALGDPERAADLAVHHLAAGPWWLHLPRAEPDLLNRRFSGTVVEDWDFLWTQDPPPAQPGEDRVVRLPEAAADGINAVIDAGLPASTSRPGDPRVRAWWGIRGPRDDLLAVAADRSRGEVGFLAGITVLPAAQGQGLGGALTAALTRRLLAEFGTCSLSVLSDNTRALRLYERLGYGESIARTTIKLD